MAAQHSIGPLRLLNHSLTLTPDSSLLWVLQTAEIRYTKLDIPRTLSAPPAPAEACLPKGLNPCSSTRCRNAPRIQRMQPDRAARRLFPYSLRELSDQAASRLQDQRYHVHSDSRW